MNDEIGIDEFFPSIPNIAEKFVKQHHGEKHSKEEWWELFSDFLDEEVFEELGCDDCDDCDCDDDSNNCSGGCDGCS